MPDLSGTKICPSVLKVGYCTLGDTCKYAHKNESVKSLSDIAKTASVDTSTPVDGSLVLNLPTIPTSVVSRREGHYLTSQHFDSPWLCSGLPSHNQYMMAANGLKLTASVTAMGFVRDSPTASTSLGTASRTSTVSVRSADWSCASSVPSIFCWDREDSSSVDTTNDADSICYTQSACDSTWCDTPGSPSQFGMDDEDRHDVEVTIRHTFFHIQVQKPRGAAQRSRSAPSCSRI